MFLGVDIPDGVGQAALYQLRKADTLSYWQPESESKQSRELPLPQTFL